MASEQLNLLRHVRSLNRTSINDARVTLRSKRDALEDSIKRRHQRRWRHSHDDKQRTDARQQNGHKSRVGGSVIQAEFEKLDCRK